MPIVVKTLNDLPPIDEQRIKKLKKMQDKDIDFSDMPALTQEQLARFVPAKLLNRSLFRHVKKPRSATPRKRATRGNLKQLAENSESGKLVK